MDSFLAQVFGSVSRVVQEYQQAFNDLDELNHNHGDHMVELFARAAQVLQEVPQASLPEAMHSAGLALQELEQNGTAQVYGDGLLSIAHMLEKYGIEQSELVRFVRKQLGFHLGAEAEEENKAPVQKGLVLKALLEGLSAWKMQTDGKADKPDGLGLGMLFDLGIIYHQAKQRGGTRVEVLADAVASASPLSKVPHRQHSGKIAFQAFLQALAGTGPGGEV